MAITHELLEEFTGTRASEMPDPENEGETITEESACIDVKVRFTCGVTSKTHERFVNVCLDADGAYDADATAARIGEVALGVANKMSMGVIE